MRLLGDFFTGSPGHTDQLGLVSACNIPASSTTMCCALCSCLRPPGLCRRALQGEIGPARGILGGSSVAGEVDSVDQHPGLVPAGPLSSQEPQANNFQPLL